MDVFRIHLINFIFDYKILLYAKNYNGYQNLCNIDTLKNKRELTIDKLYDYLDNLLVVIPFEYKDLCSELKNKTNDLFIGYSSVQEKNNIEGNKVYIKKILSLDKEKEKYIPYLYKIKDE